MNDPILFKENLLSVDKEKFAYEAVKEQINQCRTDITAFNIKFFSSSVITSLVASFAAAISTSAADAFVWKLFYILPTVFFLSLYNLIKYTGEQFKLGAYQMALEHIANKYLCHEIFTWETKIPDDAVYWLFGGAVQLVFDIPLSAVVLWGFWQAPHDPIWYVVLVFTALQMVVILIMAFQLVAIKKNVLKRLGYEITTNRILMEIK